MENKLEQLLNSLIEKGWKPFGKEKKEPKFVDIGKEMLLEWEEDYYCSKGYSYRELVSKESGLWQFCMSKGFTPNVSCYRWEKWFYDIDDLTQCEADVSGFDNYGYRLIESALCDEDKLEEFLLSNIKVDEKD